MNGRGIWKRLVSGNHGRMKTMKTRLTEWPTECPDGEWVYVTAEGGRLRGEFVDAGFEGIYFDDEGGCGFWEYEFEEGEYFEKVEVGDEN